MIVLIIKQLNPFHLSRLVRVSKAIYQEFVPDLYEHLVIRTPSDHQAWALARILEDTPKCLLQYTRRVSFITSQIGLPNAVESEEQINLLIRLLLKHLQNLNSFQFKYRLRTSDIKPPARNMEICLSDETVALVLAHTSLQGLCIHTRFPTSNIPGKLLPRLRTLSYEISIDNVYRLYQLLSTGSKTLRSLRLTSHLRTLSMLLYGVEQLLEVGHSLESAEGNHVDYTKFFYDDLSALQLNHAHFIGILPPLSISFFGCLECLVLESCPGITKALRIMRENRIHLKIFRFRQESLDLPAYLELEAFLKSFIGLRHLSILIGRVYGDVVPLPIEVVLSGHVATLKSLVWDYQDWTLRGPRWQSMKLAASLSLFPKLEQLGLSIDDDSDETLNHVS